MKKGRAFFLQKAGRSGTLLSLFAFVLFLFTLRSIDITNAEDMDAMHAMGASAQPADATRPLEMKDLFDALPMEIDRGSPESADVSITFDGGGEDRDARLILKTLRDRGIKTTIFLTGGFIMAHPDVTREIVSDGHEVGNHTLTHPHLTDFQMTGRQRTLPDVDRGFIERELKETEGLFRKITGSDMTRLWRAPFGEANSDIIRWAHEIGYIHVGWTRDSKKKASLDTLDWVSDRQSSLYRTPEEIKERILRLSSDRGVFNGGIILMHLSTERTTDALSLNLGEMIDGLSLRGYRFVRVSELLLRHRDAAKQRAMTGTGHGRGVL